MVELSMNAPEPVRTAGILQQNRVFLDFFWDLAKPDQEVRLKAVEDLIQYLKTNNKVRQIQIRPRTGWLGSEPAWLPAEVNTVTVTLAVGEVFRKGSRNIKKYAAVLHSKCYFRTKSISQNIPKVQKVKVFRMANFRIIHFISLVIVMN